MNMYTSCIQEDTWGKMSNSKKWLKIEASVPSSAKHKRKKDVGSRYRKVTRKCTISKSMVWFVMLVSRAFSVDQSFFVI